MPDTAIFGPETHALYGIEYARAAIEEFAEFLQERDAADADPALVDAGIASADATTRRLAERLRASNLKNLFLRHEVLSQQVRLGAVQGIVGALGFSVWSDEQVLKFFDMAKTIGLIADPFTRQPLGRHQAVAVSGFGRLTPEQKDETRRKFQARGAEKE